MYRGHRAPHGLTLSFPARRSSDLMKNDELLRARERVRQNADDLARRRRRGLWSSLWPESDFSRFLLSFVNVSARMRGTRQGARGDSGRSEEHTSELQSLMHISYAVLCL